MFYIFVLARKKKRKGEENNVIKQSYYKLNMSLWIHFFGRKKKPFLSLMGLSVKKIL
jgi:hypothetical protein